MTQDGHQNRFPLKFSLISTYSSGLFLEQRNYHPIAAARSSSSDSIQGMVHSWDTLLQTPPLLHWLLLLYEKKTSIMYMAKYYLTTCTQENSYSISHLLGSVTTE